MGISNSSLLGIANATIVIDVNGQIRELGPGETPAPGEVLVTVDNGNPDVPNIQADLTTEDGGFTGLDLEGEIAQIFEQLEQGVDPTANEDFATAAGGEAGSGGTGLPTIARTDAQTQAATAFDTEGLEGQGLSETQSLALIDVLVNEAPFFSLFAAPIGESIAVETDEDIAVAGQLTATDPDGDDLTFVLDSLPANGEVTVGTDGAWEYTPDDNYDGDDSFTVIVSDGLGGTDTITVDIVVNPIPEISITGPSVIDEGQDGEYTISFDKASDQETTLNLSLGLGTAEDEDIGEAVVETNTGVILTVEEDGTVVVPAGVTSLSVVLSTIQDDVYEGSESFSLNVESVSGLVGSGSVDSSIVDDGSGPGEEPDDDRPTLTVENSNNVVEGGSAVFGVELSNDVDGVLDYTFTLNVDGSAELTDLVTFNGITVSYTDGEGAQEFTISNGDTLPIPGDASGISVSVATVNDDIFEGSEHFALDVSVFGEIGEELDELNLNDSGSATIIDDLDGEDNADTPVLTVVSPDPVTEGDNAVFGVSLDKEVDGELTYTFSLNIEGYGDGDDAVTYSAEMADFLASGQLTVTYKDGSGVEQPPELVVNGGELVLPGDAIDITVSVGIENDDIFEGTESFGLDVHVDGDIGDELDELSLDGHGSATIVDENGPDFDDMPVLTVSDAGETVEGDNEFPATFLVELDKEVDGLLTYTFNLNVEGYGEGDDAVTYSAEMEDFLANGNLTVTYTVGEGDDAVSPSTAVSAVDGTVDIPGNAYNISVSVDTFNDDIFEGTESFGLDVHVDGDIGDELDELSLDGHGSATIVDENGPDFDDMPVLTVSDAGETVEADDAAAVFLVDLDKDVDGELTYTFNLN
ncbi:cadherin-like domain-containing protein, partial [Vibrio lamellibrachiae]|uniref:Ig-like domain-containing protein n=1 Tax=Vibrio lamellibrachiae TaxID=2910253 RepID=UPI003D12081E